MENSINETVKKTAFNLSAKYSLMILIVGIFLLPDLASASAVSPEKLIEMTNAERRKNNLEGLTVNPLLTEAALAKARAIISAGRFEHNINDRRFSAWVRDAGYEYSYVGENLAIDFETSEGIFEAWMDSESHHRNIINDRFREIGIAQAEGLYRGEKTTVVAQIFGTELSKVLPAQNQNVPSTTPVTLIKNGISKTYYILSSGISGVLDGLLLKIGRISVDLNYLLLLESFRLASLLFFTVSILLFYAYATVYLLIFFPVRRLEESGITC